MDDLQPILLVEDNELNREMLVRRLSRAGMEVIIAADGREALEKMIEEQPTLVLMDMNLPVLDGWSACREARKDERIKHIPILALTAHAMDADRRTALEAGVEFPGLLIKIEKLTQS